MLIKDYTIITLFIYVELNMASTLTRFIIICSAYALVMTVLITKHILNSLRMHEMMTS